MIVRWGDGDMDRGRQSVGGGGRYGCRQIILHLLRITVNSLPRLLSLVLACILPVTEETAR